MEGTTPHEVLAGFQGKVKMLERFVQENELEAVKGEIGRKLTSKDIHQAASAVSSETTKFSLGFSGSLEGGRQISERLHSSLTEFVAVVLIITNESDYCQLLKDQIRASALGVVNAISDLLKGFEKVEKNANAESASPHLTGVVWKYCKEFESVHLSNSAAVRKELNESLPLIKDATEELKELENENAGNGEDDDDGWDASEISPEMRATIPSILVLLKVAHNIVKKTSEWLSARSEKEQQEAKDLSPIDTHWFDETLALAKVIFSGVDQLGASVYEDDIDELISLAKQLSGAEKTFLDYLRKASGALPEISLPFLQLLQDKVEETIKSLTKDSE